MCASSCSLQLFISKQCKTSTSEKSLLEEESKIMPQKHSDGSKMIGLKK